MEFRRGVLIPEEKQLQNQGSWVPVTPAKPIPTRPQPISLDRQGNQLGQANWMESVGFPAGYLQETSTPNGAAPYFDSAGFVDPNRDLNNWEAALAGNNRGSSHFVGSYPQDFRNPVTGWNSIPFADLLALTNAATAASMASASTTPDRSMNAANTPFFPMSYPQIDNSRHESNSASLLLMNQDLLMVNQDFPFGTNQRDNSNSPQQIPQYGFPIPYRATYDLNSPPNRIAHAVSNGTISFQFAPVTPDQAKRLENNQVSETGNLCVDKGSNQEKDKQEDVVPPNGNEVFKLHCNEELSQHTVDSSFASVFTPLKENQNTDKEGDNGIDLNKTPQQKPRRRKHRPKVVKEGKPKRTPKPVTPRQAISKENPSGKRKYVRKNGLKPSVTPPADAAGEIIDPTFGPTVKSCKRALNFNLEGQERDESPGTTLDHQDGLRHSSVDRSSCRWPFNLNSDFQAQDLGTEINSGSGTKPTLQLSRGMELMVQNTQAGMAYDLTRSMNQILTDYMSLPDRQAPITPPPTTKDLPRGNLKVLTTNRSDARIASPCKHNGENGYTPMHQHTNAEGMSNVVFHAGTTHDNHETTIQSMLQSNPRSVQESQNDSNCSRLGQSAKAEQIRGSKRDYCHTTDQTHLRTMNQIGAWYKSQQVYQEIFQANEYHSSSSNLGPHFPEIYKKKRIENRQDTTLSSTSTSITAAENGQRRVTAGTGNDATAHLNNGISRKLNNGVSESILDAYTHSMTAEINSLVRKNSADLLSHSEALCGATVEKPLSMNRSKESTQVSNLAPPIATAESNPLPPTPPKRAPTYGNRQGVEIFHRSHAGMEHLLAGNHAKMIRKRTKKVNSVSNSSTNEVLQHENVEYDYCQSLAKSRGNYLGHKVINSRAPSRSSADDFPINSIPNGQRGSSNFCGAHDAERPGVIRKYMDPISEIVQRLKHLDINGSSNITAGEEQNALVLYQGYGKMVPYEGTFDPIKKRRPRPKVDLDPETNRVWKLLMGKEEGVEGTDKDKEKWWEEERRVFRGRADSFIARMHLVQGDRRFSQWKGSVVDSVVGVFLTQNVSDHLSSNAYMSLAARFPLQSTSNVSASYGEGTGISIEEPEVYILDPNDKIKWQAKMSSQPFCNQSSMTLHEAEHMEEREVANSYESFGSNMGCVSSPDPSKRKQLVQCKSGLEMCHESQGYRTDTQITGTGSASLVETEDRKAMEDAVSSQNSVVSSQNSVDSSIAQNAERIGSCSEYNSEAEDLTTGCKPKNFNDSTSFTELLQMAGKTIFQDLYSCGNGNLTFSESSKDGHAQLEGMEYDKQRSSLQRSNGLNGSCKYIYPSDSHHPHTQVPIIPSSNYRLHMTPDSGVLEVLGGESQSSLPSAASVITDTKKVDCKRKQTGLETFTETTVQQKLPSSAQEAPTVTQCASLRKHPVHQLCNSRPEGSPERNPHTCNNHQGERNKIFQSETKPIAEPKNLVEGLEQRRNSTMPQIPNLPNFPGETSDVVESTTVVGKQNFTANKVVESNMKEQVYSSSKVFTEVNTGNLGAKKRRGEREKKNTIDWDSLRKQVHSEGRKRERSSNAMDSMDWEAIRCADVGTISNTIRERGMNNMLAERIKDFLNRLVREHGSIDLEWLRDVPPDKAKEYLLSIRGLGLKSVECVRLLTLHHLAFPVDTNVGRIAVRLGWVPIQPLPESLQLHLLELYPVLESIQKYLWPRLCKLDQRTLYELHYQMITFGKVFCTKSKPNCNACPMRGECKHFASAFASARLALPGPEEKSIVTSTVHIAASPNTAVVINPLPLPAPETDLLSEAGPEIRKCEPIIEVPGTPEPESAEISQSDIEDAFYEDPDEIPTIKLNIEEFTLNLQNYMQENNMELQENDMSKALVALTPEAASIPTPKLKNVSRLRTEHQVYELPDSHPLLKGMDRREPDDPCSYLLAIWTPGETANSIQPPERRCESQESGKLCNENTCFSCNSIREANSQTVRGTILIPCRTAMRGSFPLNGTYFQVNEVFADHDSSLNPIDVPRAWIWNLPRRTVYFGTSIPTIFKGLSTEGIQYCFWRGFVCVRGFDQRTRAPRPLMARLHFPASKLVKAKNKQ